MFSLNASYQNFVSHKIKVKFMKQTNKTGQQDGSRMSNGFYLVNKIYLSIGNLQDSYATYAAI